MRIAVRTDDNSGQTNLFTVPQEIYKFVYEADHFSQAFARGRYIFIVLGYDGEEEGSFCDVRIFILRHKSKVDNLVYSCYLVQDADQMFVMSKIVIYTEIVYAFQLRERDFNARHDEDAYCDKLEELLVQWYQQYKQ